MTLNSPLFFCQFILDSSCDWIGTVLADKFPMMVVIVLVTRKGLHN